jgi:hypothetical protein
VVDITMDGLAWLRKQVEQANTDLLREMVKLFCERVMGEEADVQARLQPRTGWVTIRASIL